MSRQNRSVRFIMKAFEEAKTGTLDFNEIHSIIGGQKNQVSTILASYPAYFEKIQNRRWRVVPDTQINVEDIHHLYGVSQDQVEEMVEGETIRFLWIKVNQSPDGTYSRREIHKLMHTYKKEMDKQKLRKYLPS